MNIPTFKEYLIELSNPSEVKELEQYLDQMFGEMGFDVNLTKHFVERILGREQSVTMDEVTNAFAKLKAKYGDRLMQAKETDRYVGILKDFSTSLNIVFELKDDKMNNVTIIRKSPNQFQSREFPGGQQLKVW